MHSHAPTVRPHLTFPGSRQKVFTHSRLPSAVKNNFDGRTTKAYQETPTPDQTAAIASEQRWNRIVMNDLENLPIGLIVAWASYISCTSQKSNTGVFVAHDVLVLLFLAGRLLHTVAYAKGLQPWRTIGHFVAILAVGCLTIVGFVAALSV